MILGVIAVVFVVAAGIAAIGLFISAYRARDSYDSTKRDWGAAGVTAAAGTLSLLVALGVLGIWTGDINLGTDITDGCYRIASTSSSGVGVGINPKGGVTVIPIVFSGRTYTPIACPE